MTGKWALKPHWIAEFTDSSTGERVKLDVHSDLVVGGVDIFRGDQCIAEIDHRQFAKEERSNNQQTVGLHDTYIYARRGEQTTHVAVPNVHRRWGRYHHHHRYLCVRGRAPEAEGGTAVGLMRLEEYYCSSFSPVSVHPR
jgi:hypothetical protein